MPAGSTEWGAPVLRLLTPRRGAAPGAVCRRPRQMLPRRINMCSSHVRGRLDLKIAEPGEPSASLTAAKTSRCVRPRASAVSLQEWDPAAPSLVRDPPSLTLPVPTGERPSSPQRQGSPRSAPIPKGRGSTCTAWGQELGLQGHPESF